MKLNKEAQELKKADKVLGQIINQNLKPLKKRGSVYESLLRAVISQQISTSAANSVREKFLKIFHGTFPVPQELLATKDTELRSAGLSLQKVGYMKNIAKHFLDENLTEAKFIKMSNQEIIEDLTKIKGVGTWTAEMILIFSLLRKDVFSYKDLALVKPILKLYKINDKRYKPKNLQRKILAMTEKWSPHRTLASRYLWEYSNSLKRSKSK